MWLTISTPTSWGSVSSQISSMVSPSHNMPASMPYSQSRDLRQLRWIQVASRPAMMLAMRQGIEVLPSMSMR
ncbi:hypothetical protein D3C85_1633120 [compost metagenome]